MEGYRNKGLILKIKAFNIQVLSMCFMFCLFFLSTESSAQKNEVEILGWPLLDLAKLSGDRPPLNFGNDPVLGRLICPPLTRLNLSVKKSEPLVFKKILVSKNKTGETVWTLGLRSGLFWWSGKIVQTQEIVMFLEKILPDLIKEKGAGIWSLPNFSVTHDKESIFIKWQKDPFLVRTYLMVCHSGKCFQKQKMG
jgi:hypothetical protein